VARAVEPNLRALLPSSGNAGVSDGVVRCCSAARAAGLLTHEAGGRIVKVRPDYYELSLPGRLSCVGGESTEELCKCLILENTRRKPLKGDEDAEEAGGGEGDVSAGPRENPRFVCVVFQYRRRLDAAKVGMLVRGWGGDRAPAKKCYNMRLAKPDANDALSGYAHNGVVPLGMRCRDMRVIVSHHITELPGGCLFMGAGDVDVKLKSDVRRFIEATGAEVEDITGEGLLTDEEARGAD